MSFCKKCGAQLAEDSVFCGKCGCKQTEPAPAESTGGIGFFAGGNCREENVKAVQIA